MSKEFFSKLLLDSYGIFLDEVDRLDIVRKMVIKHCDDYLQDLKNKKIMKINHDPLLVEMANSLTSGDNIISSNDLIKVHLLAEINRTEANKTKIPDLIRNMIIVHLVSSYESYLRRNLYVYHIYQPNSLITINSTKNLSYEEILSCDSYEKILIKIIEKELDTLFRGGIDDIIKYFKIRLKLDLESIDSRFNSKDWDKFRERFFRRNIISHNEGISNEEYISKTKRQTNTGELLDIDDHYVTNSFKHFLDHASFLKHLFEKKL